MEENRQEIIGAEQGHMEFRLINPTEEGFLKKIQWNKEELEKAIRGKIAAYQNVVYTEDSMKQAKADRAELNKLVKAIEERRKKVKEIVNAPYATFEAEVKEVLKLIQEPAGMIDRQIKEMEKKQQDEKRNAILEAYEAVIGDMAEILPFERIFDSRYLNASYRLNTAKAEVKEKVERVRRDLETIDSMDSKYSLNAKDVYIKTLDLSAALAENKRLIDLEEKLEAEKRRRAEEEAERKRLAEEQQKQEEERRAEEERLRAAARAEREQRQSAQEQNAGAKPETEAAGRENMPEQANTGTLPNKNEAEVEIPTRSDVNLPEKKTEEEKKFRTRFFAVGTKKQLAALIQYMDENGIEYGRI